MRDDFSAAVKGQLAARVGYVCSNPGCRQPTSGPSESEKVVTNVGVAAHITAASIDGPRYDASLTPEQRREFENGIWLCQRCAKAVDDDPITYTCDALRAWRVQAETLAREAIHRGPRRDQAAQVNAAVYLGPNAVNISGEHAVVFGPNAVNIQGPILQAAPSLSAEARQLLVAASHDQNGAILVSTTFGGTFVQTDGKDFCERKNPRSVAKWRAVIQELHRSGLIEPTDFEGNVYSVTDAGYARAEAEAQ
jgi:hypothetical protein